MERYEPLSHALQLSVASAHGSQRSPRVGLAAQVEPDPGPEAAAGADDDGAAAAGGAGSGAGSPRSLVPPVLPRRSRVAVVAGLCGVALVAVGGLARAVGRGGRGALGGGDGQAARDPTAPSDATFLLSVQRPQGLHHEASDRRSKLKPCTFVTSADHKVTIDNAVPCTISLQTTGGDWHKYILSRDGGQDLPQRAASEKGARKARKHALQSDDHSPKKDEVAEAAEAVAHEFAIADGDEEDAGPSPTDNESRDRTDAATPEAAAGSRRRSPHAEGGSHKRHHPSGSSHSKGAGSNGSGAEGGAEAAAAGGCGPDAAEDAACCATFGCEGAYDVAQPCQCNSRCEEFSNCCPDFQAVCAASLKTNAQTTESPPPQTTSARSMGSPSLLCFSVIRSEGNEIGLVGAQHDRHAAIFACDTTLVFSNGPSIRIGTMDTVSIPTEAIGMGNLGVEGETTNSWLNTAVFIEVWHWLVKDGRWKGYDWTVKVDPDAVFFPERLRDHVRPYTPPGGGNYYLVNCNKRYTADPDDEVFKEKLFGALEVFSKQAVQAYQDGHKRCTDELKWHGWGEDYYMQSCLSFLGVLPVGDFTMVGDKRCFEAPCTDTGKVAFHDFKDVPAYFNCWEQSLGPVGVQEYAEHTV